MIWRVIAIVKLITVRHQYLFPNRDRISKINTYTIIPQNLTNRKFTFSKQGSSYMLYRKVHIGNKTYGPTTLSKMLIQRTSFAFKRFSPGLKYLGKAVTALLTSNLVLDVILSISRQYCTKKERINEEQQKLLLTCIQKKEIAYEKGKSIFRT